MSENFKVDGMSCAHCVAAITSAVLALPGVTGVDVDLAGGSVEVHGTPGLSSVVAAIEDAGYDARPACLT